MLQFGSPLCPWCNGVGWTGNFTSMGILSVIGFPCYSTTKKGFKTPWNLLGFVNLVSILAAASFFGKFTQLYYFVTPISLHQLWVNCLSDVRECALEGLICERSWCELERSLHFAVCQVQLCFSTWFSAGQQSTGRRNSNKLVLLGNNSGIRV